jgi:hypothetical protein
MGVSDILDENIRNACPLGSFNFSVADFLNFAAMRNGRNSLKLLKLRSLIIGQSI